MYIIEKIRVLEFLSDTPPNNTDTLGLELKDESKGYQTQFLLIMAWLNEIKVKS